MTMCASSVLSVSGARRFLNCTPWALFVSTASVTAAYLAWLILAQANFLYPLWHDLIAIDHTIEVYGPQNRYKEGFARTSAFERNRLFAAIVDAIHNQGRGLRGLVYHDTAGRPLGRLLREPEVLHLQDVARLVNALSLAGLVASVATIGLLIVIRRGNAPTLSVKSLIFAIVTALAAAAGILLLLGPVKVFYWLHTVMFPPDHHWFFYYQDSLMSTMMKAPDLFGCIALAWAILSVLVLTGLITLAVALSRSA
jgi:hypothetical protein